MARPPSLRCPALTGIEHVGLAIGKGKHRRRAYRSRLKSWMRRFNGVATKYLANYLGGRRLFEREGEDMTAQRCLLAHWREVQQRM